MGMTTPCITRLAAAAGSLRLDAICIAAVPGVALAAVEYGSEDPAATLAAHIA